MSTFALSQAANRHQNYQELKSRIHEQLLNRLNLERLAKVDRAEAEPELRSVIGSLLDKEAETTPLSLQERESIVIDVLNELFGLGPLEHLLADGEISDILVNRYNQIYVEKNGVLSTVDAVFKDDRHLMRIIERIVSSVGRRIDESSPMVDARLQDGSRVKFADSAPTSSGPTIWSAATRSPTR
jgi:pilus assembly protein CpaF